MAGQWIEVELDSFSDDEIEAEYNSRNLGDSWDDHTILTRIWVHDREGRTAEAYTLMREYVLEKLNKVV